MIRCGHYLGHNYKSPTTHPRISSARLIGTVARVQNINAMDLLLETCRACFGASLSSHMCAYTMTLRRRSHVDIIFNLVEDSNENKVGDYVSAIFSLVCLCSTAFVATTLYY